MCANSLSPLRQRLARTQSMGGNASMATTASALCSRARSLVRSMPLDQRLTLVHFQLNLSRF